MKKLKSFRIFCFFLLTYSLLSQSTIRSETLASAMLWSDPATWGGTKPVEGEEVTIPENVTILLDENPPELGGLTINGTLEFDRQNLHLTTAWILIKGEFRIGTEENPFTQKAIITLSGNNPDVDIMGMGTRGIMVMNGALELHGLAPETVWTKLNAHANPGTTSLTLMENVSWNSGDELVLAPTDYYEAGNGVSITQKVSLASVNENQIDLTTPITAFHWGLLQYATNTGMSLSPTNLVAPPVADTDSTQTPLILDQRAPIGNLTRNIVIQSPEDDLWRTEGFGVHTMIMPNAVAHIEGTEFRRAGQRGRLRRYPFHWHELSYSGSATLPDATGQYFRKNSIHSSANRGIVIHATNGVTVQENIVYDIRGHAIFTEDAVERRNIIDRNLVLHVRNPEPGSALKQHETTPFGSSGFWISNPDNSLTNNIAADCQTFGFWLAFPGEPFGSSAGVLHTDGLILNPSRIRFGTFDNNTAHSNARQGIMIDNSEINNEGATSPRRYRSTTNGREATWDNANLRRFNLSRYQTWKNRDNGIWDRAEWANNFEIVSADNAGRYFAGAGFLGIIERSLVIGTSLNTMMNGTGRPEFADYHAGRSSGAPSAFATYHSTFDIRNNIVIQFEAVEGHGSGAFSTDDYYLIPLDKGQIRNTNNLLINSHPGVKLLPVADHFTLASALWDPHGIWGPEGNYFVYNDPFIVHEKIIHEVAGANIAGGVSVSGPFYGFEGFVLHGIGDTPPQNQTWNDLMGIHVRRLDHHLNEIATWRVEPGILFELLAHMRDFITSPNSIYELTFPEESVPPTDFQMNVYNMLTEDDLQVMGIQFDGELSAQVFMEERAYTKVNSLNEVVSSGGETYWQDRCNDRVWVKMKGGTRVLPNNIDPVSDEALYERTALRIQGENNGAFVDCSTDTLQTSTTFLMNPTRPEQVAILLFSDHPLDSLPQSMMIYGTDTTNIHFAPINNSATEFSAPFTFSENGEYHYKSVAKTDSGLVAEDMRSFNIAFVTPSKPLNLNLKNLSLVFEPFSVEKNTLIFTECDQETQAYTVSSSTDQLKQAFKIEFDLLTSHNNDKLFVYRIEAGKEIEIPTQVFKRKNKAVAYTEKFGTYKLKPNLNYKGSNIVPEAFGLKQNFPNPFNPSTTIPFDLAEDGHVSLIIYNSLGQRVKTLMNHFKRAGSYQTIRWNGENENGQPVTSGIYFYQLKVNTKIHTKRMVMLK